MNLTKPIVFIDCETTGKDPKTARIVEIAILKMMPNGDSESKVRLVNPTIPIPQETTDIHGIDDDAVKDAATFKQLAKGLAEFMKGCDIAGFNSNRYDIPLLTYEFERAGIYGALLGVNFLDVWSIFCHFHPRTLSAAYKNYCGKDLEGAHEADNDVRATKDTLFCMFETHPELKDMSVEEMTMLGLPKKKADSLNMFWRDDKGDLRFNFGKHMDLAVKDCRPYCEWMLSSDFASETKKIISDFHGLNFEYGK